MPSSSATTTRSPCSPSRSARSGDGQSVVVQGLTPGQKVVVAGQYRLQPGSVVAAERGQPRVRWPRRPRPSSPRRPDHGRRHFRAFIRHPIATSLLMVGVLFVGIVAYPRLPVAPLPQVDFPTIQVSAQLARREPGDHGLVGGPAARDAIRADPGRRANDLDEHARLDRDHHPVRSRPQHRRRRQRRAGGDQRRRPANCPRTCRARRTYRKVNPADSPRSCCSAPPPTRCR